MRLLFLTPQLPYPPRQGTAIRNWGLVSGLAARHEITLLSFADTDTAPAPLARACRRVITVPAPHRTPISRLRTLLSGRPDLATRLWSSQFARTLRDLLAGEQFDVVQMEGLEMAALTDLPPLPAFGTPPSSPAGRGGRGEGWVYDAHNAETVLQRRAFSADARSPARWPAALYSALQIPRLARLEGRVCRRADRVLCVSAQDARALRALAPTVNPVIVPNGIFVSDYDPAEFAGAPKPAVVFTGKMDYRPNVDAVLWFARRILPAVRARAPETEFHIVGKNPHPSVEALRGRAGILITGEVEDTRPLIAQAAVYVAPLRMGGGTRFKLLEAMALGKAIVSTSIGAEGFEVVSGREMAIANRPDEFAGEVARLLEDEAARTGLGRAAREFVRQYDWAQIVPIVEECYDMTIASS